MDFEALSAHPPLLPPSSTASKKLVAGWLGAISTSFRCLCVLETATRRLLESSSTPPQGISRNYFTRLRLLEPTPKDSTLHACSCSNPLRQAPRGRPTPLRSDFGFNKAYTAFIELNTALIKLNTAFIELIKALILESMLVTFCYLRRHPERDQSFFCKTSSRVDGSMDFETLRRHSGLLGCSKERPWPQCCPGQSAAPATVLPGPQCCPGEIRTFS